MLRLPVNSMVSKASMVSAVLLAAGEAKRMGRQKLLMPFGRGTVLERTLDNLLASKVDEVIVVLGHQARIIKQVIDNRAVKTVINPDYKLGMSTSLITGLGLVDEQAQRIMIALADQPFINSETYNMLIEAALDCDKGIIVPVYKKERGNPVIFSTIYKQELMRLKGDVGGKQVLRQYPGDVFEVIVHSNSIDLDINTIDDYIKLQNELDSKGINKTPYA